GIRRVAGRIFTASDASDAPPVCIVNEAFVRTYLRNRSPLGMRVKVPNMSFAPVLLSREIVGVVGTVKARPNETAPTPAIYVPLAQNPWYSASLIVEPASGAAEQLIPAIRAAAARIDRDVAPTGIRTLGRIAADATARWRFRAQLVGAFALLALMRALGGVFGLAAHTVQQRIREFGLRVAIGARTVDIVGLVLGRTARVTVAGTLLGLAAAALLTRWMASLLFGIE